MLLGLTRPKGFGAGKARVSPAASCVHGHGHKPVVAVGCRHLTTCAAPFAQVPRANNDVSSSDRFPLKPTGEITHSFLKVHESHGREGVPLTSPQRNRPKCNMLPKAHGPLVVDMCELDPLPVEVRKEQLKVWNLNTSNYPPQT